MKSLATVWMMTAMLAGGVCVASAQDAPDTKEKKEQRAMRPAPDPKFDAARTLPMLQAYDRIVVALAADKTAGVAEAAGVVAKHAPNDAILAPATTLSKLDKKAKLDDVRAQFKPLSAAVVLYASGNHESIAAACAESKVPMPQKAYCPMAEAAWLQTEKKIINPFYGSGMLRCGEFQDWAEGN